MILLTTIFSKEVLSLAETIYNRLPFDEERIVGISIIATNPHRDGGVF